jgi:hypothetical protein
VVLPLWLFVGLPFVYLPIKFSSEPLELSVTMTTWLPLLSLLIGLLGGSLMAYLLGQAVAHFRRPIIDASLVRRKGCYVTTSLGNPPTHEARFLRLLIENKGKTAIHGCTGYITGIVIKSANNQEVQEEVLKLKWSHGDASPRNIPIGTFFHMDIASLVLTAGNHVLWLGVESMPSHLAPLLLTAGTFELQIKIAAENAQPLDRKVAFEFQPQADNLRVQFD